MMWASHMTMLGSSAEVVVQMDDKSSSSCLTQSRRGLCLVYHWETAKHRRYHENTDSASTREKITCIVNAPFALLSTDTLILLCCVKLFVGFREALNCIFQSSMNKIKFATRLFLLTDLLLLTSSLIAVNWLFINKNWCWLTYSLQKPSDLTSHHRIASQGTNSDVTVRKSPANQKHRSHQLLMCFNTRTVQVGATMVQQWVLALMSSHPVSLLLSADHPCCEQWGYYEFLQACLLVINRRLRRIIPRHLDRCGTVKPHHTLHSVAVLPRFCSASGWQHSPLPGNVWLCFLVQGAEDGEKLEFWSEVKSHSGDTGVDLFAFGPLTAALRECPSLMFGCSKDLFPKPSITQSSDCTVCSIFITSEVSSQATTEAAFRSRICDVVMGPLAKRGVSSIFAMISLFLKFENIW